MSIEKVRSYFSAWDMESRILEFPVSSATVELAAQALNTEPCRIAKTLSFAVQERTVLVVTAGDARVNSGKFKAFFGVKAKMLGREEAEEKIGHGVGGVCPFAVKDGVEVYLDESLRRFRTVFPACGSSNSAIELTIPELEECSRFTAWVDVCKRWQE